MKLQSFLSSEELLRISFAILHIEYVESKYLIYIYIYDRNDTTFVYFVCLTKGKIPLGICQSRLRCNNGCRGEAPASAAAALAAAAERGHAKVVSTLRCLDLPRTMTKQ